MNLKFLKFLQKIQKAELPLREEGSSHWDDDDTSTTITIQQTPRNQIRREGLEALLADLTLIYGNHFDIVETRDGIVIAVENEPSDLTFSWEIKSTIKNLSPYDPFIEADRWEEEKMRRASKQANKQASK